MYAIPSVIDDGVWSLVYLTNEMTYTHPNHDENECNPRHQRSLDTESNEIRAHGTQEDNP